MHPLTIVTKVGIAAVALAASLVTAQAEDCRVLGNPSSWGTNMIGAFEIDSGRTCQLGISLPGVINTTKIKERPQHGVLKQVSLSNFSYTAKAGYKGKDAFAVVGTGQGPSSSGTSVITLNVTVR